MPFAIPSNSMNYSCNIICLINYYWPQVMLAGENGPLRMNLIQIRYLELVPYTHVAKGATLAS